MARATVRSAQQARARPRAVVEISLLHAAFSVLGGRRARRWTAVSWALTVTHLGLQESRSSLSVADALTLIRANLPASPAAGRPGVAALALGTDIADGWIARRNGTGTPFGRDADAIADAVFWTWFAFRHEPSPVLRLLALAAWTAPVAVVTVVSVARGEMVNVLRPPVARPAAAFQILLTARAVRASMRRHRCRCCRCRRVWVVGPSVVALTIRDCVMGVV